MNSSKKAERVVLQPFQLFCWFWFESKDLYHDELRSQSQGERSGITCPDQIKLDDVVIELIAHG
jgi:hypothetical protein